METLSQHLGQQIRKKEKNPELEKHLIRVALVPPIEKAIRLGLTESEFLGECREIFDTQTHSRRKEISAILGGGWRNLFWTPAVSPAHNRQSTESRVLLLVDWQTPPRLPSADLLGDFFLFPRVDSTGER